MNMRIVRVMAIIILAMHSAYAFRYAQKTFLMPRAIGTNAAIEHTGMHAHTYRYHYNNHTYPAHFVITPFFQQTVNADEFGRYFAYHNRNNKLIVGDTAADTNDIDKVPQIDGKVFVRKDTEQFTGTMSFLPRHTSGGIRLDYINYLPSTAEGLFFQIQLPLAHVSSTMGLRATDEGSVTFGSTQEKYAMTDYLKGNAQAKADQALLRDALAYAKMPEDFSRFGLADFTFALGYRLIHDDTRHCIVRAHVTAPTGNKVTGEYLFEPMCGNGKHPVVGVGIESGLQLWRGMQGETWCDVVMRYSYLCEASQTRTLGITGVPFAHYYLMSTTHTSANPQPFFPAANRLTQDVRVRGGSQLEALVHLSYQSTFLIADLGYNLYWKEREGVWLKKPWQDDEVGLINESVATNTAITKEHFIDNAYVNEKDLDLNVARTPTQLSHTFYAGITYMGALADYPASIGIGGSYEYAEDNATAEQYAVWVKMGVSL